MLVSVLIPVYNVAQYLPKCLDSIVNQTYQQLQVVVVDDGSSDNSLSIVKDYAAKYPFVEVYHQENAGVAAARNNLLSHVKGDYILFVDSDDWLELDMIEFLISKIERYKVDVVTCGMVVNDTAVRKEYKQECWNQEVTIQKFLFHKELSGSLWNKLVLTSLLHNVVFHCGISYGEDALFCWKFFQNISSLLYTDRQLYHYRMNQASISHSKWSPEKMGSGHIVWKLIEKETYCLWPQFARIASTSFVVSDLWQLYYASLSNYPYDSFMKMYQKRVRDNIILIRESKSISFNKKVFAEVISRSYYLGKILAKLFRK